MALFTHLNPHQGRSPTTLRNRHLKPNLATILVHTRREIWPNQSPHLRIKHNSLRVNIPETESLLNLCQHHQLKLNFPKINLGDHQIQRHHLQHRPSSRIMEGQPTQHHLLQTKPNSLKVNMLDNRINSHYSSNTCHKATFPRPLRLVRLHLDLNKHSISLVKVIMDTVTPRKNEDSKAEVIRGLGSMHGSE